MKTNPSRLAAIDGIRGVCVLVVIVSHLLHHSVVSLSPAANEILKVVFHGTLGVQCFFVVSGFIITHLLLREVQSTGSVALTAFYKRRFIRLVPALYFFVAVASLGALLLNQLPPTPGCVASALTFTEGFLQNCNWDFAHLWSLTVEEVFYLTWPLLLTVFAKRSLPLLLLPIILFSIASRTLGVLAGSGRVPGFLGVGSGVFGFMDQIAVGALLGYFYTCFRVDFYSRFAKFPALYRLAGLFLIYCPQFLAHRGIAGFFLVPAGTLIEAFGMALLIGSYLVAEKGISYSILTSRPLVKVGLISYSLYLWQQVFFGTFAAVPLTFLGMLMMALFSYHWIECPARNFLTSPFWRKPTNSPS